MGDTKELAPGRVLAKIVRAFMYNGTMLEVGQSVDMNEERAVNHMRAGDVERDNALVEKVKNRRLEAAKAAQADAEGNW